MNTSPLYCPSILPARLLLLAATLLGALILQMPGASGVRADGPGDVLTSQPALKVEAPTPVKVGATLKTAFGQRRRAILQGGAVIYLNENTEATIRDSGIELMRGQVFVETAKGFTVKTANHSYRTEHAKFVVGVYEGSEHVYVIAGKVREDNKTTLEARWGIDPMPRASHLFGWLKDLMIAAEPRLVPASDHAGGNLVAVDPDGQEAKITLRKYYVDVVIQDGFASTTIDQTYFNHEQVQLEGTFYFPLPPDASLSRLAMYVGGNLMEGGMAERDYARNVYETIRYANRDPALLEWLDGSTFKMRVFPMEPRTEKRIILAYTQKLPTLYDQTTYRFPSGHSLKTVEKWSVSARLRDGGQWKWHSPSHQLKAHKDGDDLVLEASIEKAKLDRDLVLEMTPPKGMERKVAQFHKGKLDGADYLMVRYRPELKGAVAAGSGLNERPAWLFLVEASGDRDPLLARAQIEVVRHLLGHLAAEDTFLVGAANTKVRFQSAKPQAATAENIAGAIKFLESVQLIGALDLGSALEELGGRIAGQTIVVHLGSGVPAMGEKREGTLVKKLPAGSSYVGIGVGHRWNRAFMKAAAEATGGHYTQINPDEPLGWRTFDLFSALTTPRLQKIEVIAQDGHTVGQAFQPDEKREMARPQFLLLQQSISQGEELCAVTRTVGQASSLPKTILIRGFVNGKPFEQSLKVTDPISTGDYLPRAWAKLEIDRLLAEDPVKHHAAIVALSKAMYVMTPFTSLLVLEHEDLYAQYKVDRGRKDHWAMYQCPQKIPVVYEPEPGQPDPRKLAGKPTAKQVVETIAMRESLQVMASRGESGQSRGAKVGQIVILGGSAAGRTVNALRSLASDHFQDWSVGLTLNTPLGQRTERLGAAGATFGNWNAQRESLLKRAEPDVLGNNFTPYSLAIRKNIREQQVVSSISGSLETPVVQSEIAGRSTFSDKLFPQRAFPVGDLVIPVAKREAYMHLGAKNGGGFKNMPLELSAARFDAQWLGEVPHGADERNLLHTRPGYTADDRIFFDLLAYAPGMNTSAADMQAVVEAEAYPSASSRIGQVDAAARDLFTKARVAGWQSLTFAGEGKKAGFRISFDGDGRYVYERTLPPGIDERVVCDGTTITHAYPQLFVGAKRDVSRFHRADLAGIVPWYLPPPDDLAKGADVKWIGERTVAIVPHYEAKLRELVKDQKDAPKIEWLRVHLVFGGDGRLAERRLVRMPDEKTVYRQILEPSGNLRVVDDKGKELFVRKGQLAALPKAPNMTADTRNLVVLQLPYRSADHVRQTLKLEKKNLPELRLAEAVPLFAAYIGAGKGDEAITVFRQCIAAREQKQLGYYVLLGSCGFNLDSQNGDVLGEHPNEPLAQYLALHTSPVLRKHASQWAVVSGSWNEGFLQHLAQTHALYQKWQNERVVKGDPAKVKQERQKALDYVRKNQDSVFGWALLSLMQDRAAAPLAPPGRGVGGEGAQELENYKNFHGELAEAWRLFEVHPVLGPAARYEVARSLYKAGQLDAARKRFTELYQQTLKEETLPALDEDFRRALLGRDAEEDGWSTLMRETANQLVKQKKRPAVLALAWQTWQLGDEPLANSLLQSALYGIDDAKEKTAMQLAGLDFLWQTKQIPQADAMLKELAEEKELAKNPGLWRLGVQFAEQRDMPDRTLDCLEKALDREFVDRPEVIDLQVVRQEYGKLLGAYDKLADSMVMLKLKPPADFTSKVIRAADRWRALDRESSDACTTVAWILQRLGDTELAWDYLTTPVAHKPSESGPWLNMATNLSRRGVLDLADRAFKAAFEAEPTNPQILWDRATNLRQAGKTVEAQALFRQIAEGDWQPRFQGLRNQARSQVSGN